MIPQADGYSCIDEIMNCVGGTLGYGITDEMEYYCEECLNGYYHDFELGICAPCDMGIDGCTRCESEHVCEVCAVGLFLDFTKERCRPDITHCVAALEGEPDRSWALGEDETFICPSCDPGFFWDWDAENCVPCAEDCVKCSEHFCIECEDHLVPNGRHCDEPALPNCRKVDPDDETRCLACHTGFAPNLNHT